MRKGSLSGCTEGTREEKDIVCLFSVLSSPALGSVLARPHSVLHSTVYLPAGQGGQRAHPEPTCPFLYCPWGSRILESPVYTVLRPLLGPEWTLPEFVTRGAMLLAHLPIAKLISQ